jgi:ABC-2 type transport system permease protein
VPVAVVDLDGSAVSKTIVASMKADTAFDLKELPQPDAVALVREGKARAAVVIPAGFGDAAPKAMFAPNANKPEIGVHFDPSQAIALQLVRGLLAEHVMRGVSSAAFSPEGSGKMLADMRREVGAAAMAEGERRDLMLLFDSVERLQSHRQPGQSQAPGGGGFSLPFTTAQVEVTGKANARYNPFSHSFAGMGVQFVLFMGIEVGVGILLMRRLGLWKRLRAAPVSRTLLLGSRIVSGTLIATLLLAGIYAAGIAFFGVRIEGSIAGFIAIAIAFAILTATFGLLIAALGKTPEATRGLAVLATLLLVMLGGAWVPTFVFPEWLQAATLFIPTRWAVDGLEAMTWRGLGFEAALAPVASMLAFSALFALAAIKRFDWEE